MCVVGNCGNEEIVSLVKEVMKDFCEVEEVSHANFSCNGKLGMYSIGKTCYGPDFTSIEEVVTYIKSNKKAVEERWFKLKGYLEDYQYEKEAGYWFLTDSVTDCFVMNDNTYIGSDLGGNSLLSVFNCHKSIVKLIDLKVVGDFCYDSNKDILYESSVYNNLVGKMVADYCGIKL